MKQTHSITILVLLSLAFCLQCRPQKAEQSVKNSTATVKAEDYVLDTIITKRIPLTVDGEWATINYHLKVKDWKKPVEWTFVVVNDKDTIYEIVSIDARIDTFFYDNNYICYDSGGYFANKKGWYLNGIGNFHCDTLSPKEKRRVDFKKCSKNYFLSEFGANKNEQLDNWYMFWNDYDNKIILIYTFNDAPECDPELLVYFNKLKRFVPIYAP